jgi:ATP-dependent Clp protease adaptor protein ClpS
VQEVPVIPASQPVSPAKQAPAERRIEYDLSHLDPWREYSVILYNDEEHSMGEVVAQIMKALGCSLTKAHALMLEAHTKGQAVVAITGQARASRIADVLRQINLRVSLHQLN